MIRYFKNIKIFSEKLIICMILRFISLLIIFEMIFVSISFVLVDQEYEIKKKEILSREEKLVEIERTVINSDIHKIIQDTVFLKDMFKIYKEESLDDDIMKKGVISFLKRNNACNSLTYINNEKNEVIALKKDSAGRFIYKKNIENLDKRIEKLIDNIDLSGNKIHFKIYEYKRNNYSEVRPAIDIVIPYIENDIAKGIIVVNYSTKAFLEKFKKIASKSSGKICLTYGSSDDKSSISDRQKNMIMMPVISFCNKYKIESEFIYKNEDGILSTTNGVFISTKILSSMEKKNIKFNNHINIKGDNMYVVDVINKNSPEGKILVDSNMTIYKEIFESNFRWGIIFIIFAFFISWVMVLHEAKKQKIKYLSEHDFMTDVYNRQAGMDRLEKLNRASIFNVHNLSICFLDINGLKQVNDTLGHNKGDELILTVIKSIKRNIKQNDFIVRIGGDEFLIVMKNINKEQAEKIWNRIKRSYEEVNQKENRLYRIEASHGIVELDRKNIELIDEVISKADSRMYVEKNELKRCNQEIIRKK